MTVDVRCEVERRWNADRLLFRLGIDARRVGLFGFGWINAGGLELDTLGDDPLRSDQDGFARALSSDRCGSMLLKKSLVIIGES